MRSLDFWLQNSLLLFLPKKSLAMSSGPHLTSRGVWGGGVGLVRVRACVEAIRNHRWTKLGVEFLAQHTQLVKSWLLPFYYLDLFRTVSTAIKLDIGKRNNVLTEPELLDL